MYKIEQVVIKLTEFEDEEGIENEEDDKKSGEALLQQNHVNVANAVFRSVIMVADCLNRQPPPMIGHIRLHVSSIVVYFACLATARYNSYVKCFDAKLNMFFKLYIFLFI